MLKQLLKYEFKATGRTYGGLYLALVALAVLSGFSLRSSSKDNFASLLLFAYMVVAVAVAVVSVMTIVTRFTRNLLGREGYLMHTLPVTESQLILSKLISSVVWMLCSSIVGIFSFAVMLLALSLNSAALQQLPEQDIELILLVKASSLVSVVGIMEVTRASQAQAATTFRPLEVYLAAACIYLLINLCLAVLGR